MQISRRAIAIQESPIRKLAPLAAAARARGVTIYNLNIGQPDVPTPPEFLQAVCGFKDPVLAYGPSDGLPELREAMADYFARYEIALDPAEILITNGGSEAILFAFNVVGRPGRRDHHPRAVLHQLQRLRGDGQPQGGAGPDPRRGRLPPAARTRCSRPRSRRAPAPSSSARPTTRPAPCSPGRSSSGSRRSSAATTSS